MSARRQKLDSYSENANEGLTIYDAPNVCREMMARGEELAGSDNPEVASAGREMADFARRMLDAIVASTDQLLAMGVSE